MSLISSFKWNCYCCRSKQSHHNQTQNSTSSNSYPEKDLPDLPITDQDIEQGRLSPEQIRQLEYRDQIEKVPDHQVNFLSPQVVANGFLSKHQYQKLSNLHLIKRVPVQHLYDIQSKYINQGQISMLAIDNVARQYLGYNDPSDWQNIPSPLKIWEQVPEELKYNQRFMNKNREIDEDRLTNDEIEDINIFTELGCQKTTKYFQSTAENHPVVTHKIDYHMEERPNALIFIAHQKSDYNGALEDDIVSQAELNLLSQSGFNFEKYTVAFEEEITEIVQNYKDENKKVRLKIIDSHGDKNTIFLGCDSSKDINKEVVSHWQTKVLRAVTKRSAHPSIKKDALPALCRSFDSILDHKSFLVTKGCNTANSSSSITKTFADHLDNTIVFGCETVGSTSTMMLTSANPNHISYSLITKGKFDDPKESIGIYPGKNRK